VPKGLQRYFNCAPEKIWYAKRDSIQQAFLDVELRNIGSAFRKRDFYSILDENDRLSDDAERNFYGPVDDHLGKLLEETISILESGRAPIFKGETLESFKSLVVALTMRSIDAVLPHNDDDIGKGIIEGTLADSARVHGISPDEARKLIVFPSSKHLGRNVRVNAQIAYPGLLLDALTEYRVAVVSTEARTAFILGSKMVYRIANGTKDVLGSENVELWFPMSPRYCLVLHAIKNDLNGITILPRDKVREVNEFIIRECLEVGSHSESLICSLLRIKGSRA
jgi:Protein of unknown function (DUF4238)